LIDAAFPTALMPMAISTRVNKPRMQPIDCRDNQPATDAA
jgi:hypothetical protein